MVSVSWDVSFSVSAMGRRLDPLLDRRCDHVAHRDRPGLEPGDRLPGDEVSALERLLANAAAQACAHAAAADDEPHQDPVALPRVRAEVVHPAQLLARLGAHLAADEVARADHAPGSFSTRRAWRSSPWPRPRSRAFVFSLMTASMSSTCFHGTRISSRPSTPDPNMRWPTGRRRSGSRRD